MAEDDETYYNVEVSFIGGEYQGRYSLYETVEINVGKPFHLVEDLTLDPAVREYVDRLILLEAPDESAVAADLAEVTWYFTEEGYKNRIESKEKLSDVFNSVAGKTAADPYRRAEIHLTETTRPGTIVYEDAEQIAALPP